MSEEESVSSSNASEEAPLHDRKVSTEIVSDSHPSCSSGEKYYQRSQTKDMLRASAPTHKKLRESPLSSDAMFHQSHGGLFNLCIVILVAVNSRLIIENLMKYGLLIRGRFLFSSKFLTEWPVLMCGLSLPLLALCSYSVEKLKIYFRIPELIMFILHFFISTLSILYPVYVIMRLNIIAELTYFGDREFYKDWWNAKTIEEYWKSWNMPVHKWMVRHVYFPCLRKGISKDGAILISFIISGVFHELCIGIPCHMFRCWAFLGIMFQVPLIVLTNYLHNRFHSTMVGNVIFWFFFCIVGQPMSLLLYYHDYINHHTTF